MVRTEPGTATLEIDDAGFRELAGVVQGHMERLHVPGVALGVLHEGREQTAGLGVTNVDHPLPVDADTLFQIGSITKTFTGTVAMMLVEQGRLDLDAPLRTYLPKLRLKDEEAAARVTMRHLLQHTAGWVGDYFDDTGPGEDALRRMVTRMAKLPQLTPLGEVWSYNNSGFYLAGRVIEVLTRKPYEQLVKETIFEPLGMDHSFFFAGDVMTHRFAVGHTVKDDRAEIAAPWPLARAAHPAGGIASTARDMLRYASFQMGDGTAPDGTRLLTGESMAEMQRPQVPTGTAGGATGITWMVKDVDGVRTIRHGGGTNGQISIFLVAPERDFALVVLTNANRGGEVTDEAVKWALRHYLGVAEPDPSPLQLTEEQLRPYVGRYVTAMSEAEISLEDGELVLQVTPKGGFPYKDSPPDPPPPPTRVAVLEDDGIVALDSPFKGARGECIRNPDGSIAWLRFGGRIGKRQA